MTAAQRNIRIAQRVWQAVSDGDADELLRLYHPELVWQTDGRNPFAQEVKGAHEVLEMLARAGEDVDDLRSRALEFFGSERGAVIHYRVSAERGPKRLDTELVMLLRMHAGRVTNVRVIPADQDSNDAFWRVE